MASIFGSLRACVGGLPIRCLSPLACATRSHGTTQSTLCSAWSCLPRSQSPRIPSTKTYCSTSAIMTKPIDSDDFRLPLDVAPTHYDLTVKTDLENSTFEGVVKIEYVHTHRLSRRFTDIPPAWMSRRKHLPSSSTQPN